MSDALRRISYVTWATGRGGSFGEAQSLSSRDVADRVRAAKSDNGLVLAVAALPSGVRVEALFASLGGDEVTSECRPLTGPYFVPSWWRTRRGARGFVMGSFQDSNAGEPLILAVWPVGEAGLSDFVRAVEARKNAWPMTSPAHVRTLVERLIDPDSAESSKIEYARALRDCEGVVEHYERAFRSGHDFTWEEHIRIEQLLQELVLRETNFSGEGKKAERLGLVSRLVRLLDAQASRDASGTVQHVLTLLTAVVLVPTLVVGTFGANVAIPYSGLEAMRWAMFGFMACGGVLSYLLLDGVRRSSSTRTFVFALPGAWRRDEADRAWWSRIGFSVAAGAAAGICVVTCVHMWDSGISGIEYSTTSFAVVVAILALGAVLVAIIVSDSRWRSGWHAAAVAAAAVTAGVTSSALLVSSWQLAAAAGGGLFVAASLALYAIHQDSIVHGHSADM